MFFVLTKVLIFSKICSYCVCHVTLPRVLLQVQFCVQLRITVAHSIYNGLL